MKDTWIACKCIQPLWTQGHSWWTRLAYRESLGSRIIRGVWTRAWSRRLICEWRFRTRATLRANTKWTRQMPPKRTPSTSVSSSTRSTWGGPNTSETPSSFPRDMQVRASLRQLWLKPETTSSCLICPWEPLCRSKRRRSGHYGLWTRIHVALSLTPKSVRGARTTKLSREVSRHSMSSCLW